MALIFIFGICKRNKYKNSVIVINSFKYALNKQKEATNGVDWIYFNSVFNTLINIVWILTP